jgi:hypoxanthine phosphoribosyltransferase
VVRLFKNIDSAILDAEFYCKLYTAKNMLRLADLSEILGLDVSVISKYIHRKIEPSGLRKRAILEAIRNLDHTKLIEECVVSKIYPFPETNNILYGCPGLVYCVVYEVLQFIKDVKPDTMITLEGGGLAVASILHYLTGLKLIYGLRDIVVVGSALVSIEQYGVDSWGPRVKRFIAFPLRRDLLGGDVLIIDDIAWTGNTCISMYKFAKRRFNVKGVFLIAAFESALRRLQSVIDAPVKTIITIPDRLKEELYKLKES